MQWVGIAASIIVGVTFVVAGASKLAAGPSWPANARDLGAPRWAIPLVPWIEMIVGAALAVQLVVPVPALVALALLATFSVLIAVRLRAGDRPVCACFGQWSASPLGAHHLVRNAALAVLAVLAGLFA